MITGVKCLIPRYAGFASIVWSVLTHQIHHPRYRLHFDFAAFNVGCLYLTDDRFETEWGHSFCRMPISTSLPGGYRNMNTKLQLVCCSVNNFPLIPSWETGIMRPHEPHSQA